MAVVGLADGVVEVVKEGQSRGCDADKDFTAIWILAAAADEAALFEAVEEAGDIGIAGDHAAGDLAAEQAVGRAAQDAKDVVLVRGEVVAFQELGRCAGEEISGADEIDEDGFLGTGGGFGCSRYAGHSSKMVVGTDKCQKGGCEPGAGSL